MADPESIRVIAAVIEEGGRWLVGRSPEGKRHGGLWEFPGGKVHAGESMLDAAGRELEEELSLRATAVGQTLFTIRDGDSPFVIDFVEVSVTGTPTAHEHSEIVWVGLADLQALALAPADGAFVKWMASGSVSGTREIP